MESRQKTVQVYWRQKHRHDSQLTNPNPSRGFMGDYFPSDSVKEFLPTPRLHLGMATRGWMRMFPRGLTKNPTPSKTFSTECKVSFHPVCVCYWQECRRSDSKMPSLEPNKATVACALNKTCCCFSEKWYGSIQPAFNHLHGLFVYKDTVQLFFYF